MRFGCHFEVSPKHGRSRSFPAIAGFIILRGCQCGEPIVELPLMFLSLRANVILCAMIYNEFVITRKTMSDFNPLSGACHRERIQFFDSEWMIRTEVH